MKIAIYVPSWPPGAVPNGIVTYASHLVPALRSLGHEVFVLARRIGASDAAPHTIDLQNFESPFTLWDRAIFKIAPDAALSKMATSVITAALLELINKHKIDVAEFEESFGWSSAISRRNLLPVVVRLHGPWCLNGRFVDDQNPLNRRREEWEGRAIRVAQVVTAPSAAVLQAVKQHYGFNPTASRVIPNPLDAAPESGIWNAKTCRPESLLFVGRFDALKGGDLMLRAFGELAASRPRLTLTFVGLNRGVKSARGEMVLFDEFVRTSVPQEIWNRIEYRGEMNHSDVMSLRRKHFATIVASQHEMMPYSVLEAMSLGCPLVATAVGGIPELIKNQSNGLLVPSQNIGAMVAACEMLLNDHSLAVRLGLQAWRDCREHHRPQTVAQDTAEAYREAIRSFHETRGSSKPERLNVRRE